MEFKNVDSLSITECCEHLDMNRQNLPSIVEQIDVTDKREVLLLERLKVLLEEDKVAFQSCTTISAYENYLSTWLDGLWREQAKNAIKHLMAEAEELECYKKNKDSISGCKIYLTKYPNGRFAAEIKNTLNKKTRKRMARSILVFLTMITIAAIFCWYNYEPASYLSLTGNGEFDKIGGETQITYNTDATSNNIDIERSEDWINLEDNGNGKITITVSKNYEDQRNGTVTVKAYSSFFGKQYNRILKKVEISQKSGLPTYLNVNTANISFDKLGICKTVSNFDVMTDGCELYIEPNADWFTVSKEINDNIETMSASVNVTGKINDEGEKLSYITIRSGNITKRVDIYQESGLATYFRVKRATLVMAEEGLEEGYCYPIDVETDGTSWSVKNAPSWLTANADMSQKRLEVYVGPNSGRTKKGTITLMSNNGDVRDIDVTQKGDPTDFDSSKSSIRFGTSSDYEYVSIDNNSDKALSVRDSESWLSCSVTSKNKIKISCSSNNSSPRSGTVYVSCGGESLSISIKQDGWRWEDCRDCGGNGTITKACSNGEIMRLTSPGIYMPIITVTVREWAWGMHVESIYTNGQLGYQTPCSACGGSGRITTDCDECENGRVKRKVSY